MNSPLVSVCIPVFNTVKYVQQTIESVLAQNYSNIEILIQDNASTDGTWELLEALDIEYPKIKLERNQLNLGMSGNWNKVIRRAQGDYVMLLSADDLLGPEFLASCIKSFMEDDVDFVSTHFDFLLADGSKKVRTAGISGTDSVHQNFACDVLKINPFQINFTLFKKSFINKFQSDGNLFSKYVTCDYGLFLRLGVAESRMKYLATSLGYYRIHESNTSNNQLLLQWHGFCTLLGFFDVLIFRCPKCYLRTLINIQKRLVIEFAKSALKK